MNLKTTNDVPGYTGTLLVLGDAVCLEADLLAFMVAMQPVTCDVFACNRSVLSDYISRPVTHWGAADGEEAIWMSLSIQKLYPATLRHTMAPEIKGFNVFWTPEDDRDPETWRGTTAVMATMAGLAMGYDKIVLVGCPMDDTGRWYDPGRITPWTPAAFQPFRWMKNKQLPVRSMSGRTKDILGGIER